MNKKIMTVMGISGAIMLGSVYSISANTSGYELYKSAFKQTHEAKSATVSVNFALEDNDKTIFSGDSVMKADKVQKVNSISTKLMTEAESSSMNMYKQQGKWFVEKVGNDVIYEMDASNPHQNRANELQDDMENLIDVATKNLQQQITVDHAKNGSYKVELDLTGKEIPLTANAISSLLIKHSVMIQDKYDQNSSNFHLTPTLPELEHDISVKQMKISANVNKENYLDQQEVKVVVVGKDANGKAHEITLNFNLEVTNYNKTLVAPTEIAEEKVEKLEMKHGHGGR
jgi:hypothetical protein